MKTTIQNLRDAATAAQSKTISLQETDKKVEGKKS